MRRNTIESLERRAYFVIDIAFAPFTSHPAGEASQGIDIADFNNDGNDDVVVTNFNAGTVSILLGNGTGGLSAPTAFDVGPALSGVTAGDINGDALPDLIAIGDDAGVLIGNGDGTFDPAIHIAVGDTPQNSAIGDVNDDGIPDVVVANVLSAFTSVLIGNGDGTFQAPDSEPVAGQADVAIGDVNDDGIPDLAMALFGDIDTGEDNGVAVLIGNGDGTFDDAVTFDAGTRPFAIALGDINGDGLPDIVCANGGIDIFPGSDDFSVLINQGDGDFADAVNVPSGVRAGDIVLVDFDGDGALDVATASSGSNDVKVHKGNGDGTFAAPLTLLVNANPNGIASGDLNRDGRPDLVTSNFGNNASVLLNTTLFAELDGGVLTMTGTETSDTFALSQVGTNVRISRNGIIQVFPLSPIERMALSGGAGNDLVTLGLGIPTIFVDAGTGNDVVLADPGLSAAIQVTGAGGNDLIVGGAASDELSGANGKDRIFGGLGSDSLLGGASHDYLFGGRGDDTCVGGGGNDRLFGDAGFDYLRGGAGNDFLDSALILSGVDGIDTVSGNAGSDTGRVRVDDIVAGVESVATVA